MIREERKKKRTKEKMKLLVEIALLVAAAVCLVCAAVYYIKGSRAETAYDELAQESVIIGTETEAAEQAETALVYEDMPQVDFTALWETNTDICAWIFIPGTQVNYPVLQNAKATEPYDSYYLQHTVDGASGLPGSIYIEPCNSRSFTDYNTVFYGHHMKNGSMFASLDSFLEENFMEENPYVYLVTPEKSMVYEVFAAVQYDDRHIMGGYDFADRAQRQSFLDSLAANGGELDILREDMEVTADDRIITLSTCVKGQDERRLLVEAVLVDEMEK